MKHFSLPAWFLLCALFQPLLVNADGIDVANQAADRGEVREAIIQLKNILQKDPENA